VGGVEGIFSVNFKKKDHFDKIIKYGKDLAMRMIEMKNILS